MKAATDLSRYVSSLFTDYLSGIRNLNPNTISSYRDAFVHLLNYLQEEEKIPIRRLKIADIQREQVENFLLWLETNKENGISTRNQRLAAIHTFFRYLQSQEPKYMFQCQTVLAIPRKKVPQPIVSYLSQEQVQRLLLLPDTHTPSGLRGCALLTLLYNSGARVQELVDLAVRDVRIDVPAVVRLTGKGRKTRIVPLMNQTTKLLKEYMYRYELTERWDGPYFCNRQGVKPTRQDIAYILRKYAQKAGIPSISPHVLRHTKAMHMVEAGINPIYIRDVLVHADLKTTDIYAKTNTELKRAALSKLDSGILPASSATWNEDRSLMAWLTSLGK